MENETSIQKPQLPTTVDGNCHNCQTKLQVPFPRMPIFNDPTVSTVAVPHIKGIDCPMCGTYHNIYVAGANIALALVPYEKPILNEDSRIIQFRGKLPGPQ